MPTSAVSAGFQPAEQPVTAAAAEQQGPEQQAASSSAAGPQLPELEAGQQPELQRSSSSQLIQHAQSGASSQALTGQASGSGQLHSQLPSSAGPPDPGGAADEAGGDEDAALAARLQAEELQVPYWLVCVLRLHCCCCVKATVGALQSCMRATRGC